MEKEVPVIHERSNILSILKRAQKAVKEKDSAVLKDLSNKTIHSASIYQDTDSIALAVVIYAVSKIIERANFRKYKDWQICKNCIFTGLDKAVRHLEKNDLESFRADLLEIRKVITQLSGNLKRYVSEVFKLAAINKASRIYEHGISLEQTANLLGITMFELAEYTGRTGISDVNLNITMPFEARFQRAEEFLK